MRICAYQGKVVPGNAEANLAKTEETLAQAQDRNAAILCMPEFFLQGILRSREEALRTAIAVDSRAFRSIVKRFARYRPQLLLGFLEREGGRVYISQAVLERGRLLGVYRKVFTATREVDRGDRFPVFECRGVKYGVIVCADSSAVEPARILAMRGVQLLFAPHWNYMPYADVDRHTREVRASHVARAIENRLYVVRSNIVMSEAEGVAAGQTPGLGVGDSFVVDSQGRFIAEAGLLTETLLTVDLPDDALATAGLGYLKAPFLFPTPAVARTFSAEIRQYAKRSGPPPA